MKKIFAYALALALLLGAGGCAGRSYQAAKTLLDEGSFAKGQKMLKRLKDDESAALYQETLSQIQGVGDEAWYYGTQALEEISADKYFEALGVELFDAYVKNETVGGLADIILSIRKAEALQAEEAYIMALYAHAHSDRDELFIYAIETYWRFLCDRAFDAACKAITGEDMLICASYFAVQAQIYSIDTSLAETTQNLKTMLMVTHTLPLTRAQLESMRNFMTIFAPG